MNKELLSLPSEFREQPLSAARLEDYSECPRRFLLSFFVSPEEQQRFYGGPAALHAAVREALVDCYKHGGPTACSLNRLREAFELHWHGELCADSIEEETLHAQGLGLLEQFYEDHQGKPLSIIAADQRLEAFVEGQAYVAVADLISQPADEERVHITRFVTTRRPPSQTQLKEDLRAGLFWLLAHEDVRLQAIAGEHPPRVFFYSLRRREALEIIFSPEEASTLRRRLVALAQQIKTDTEFLPRKGRHCRFCRVRNKCPLWRSPRGE